MGSFEVVKVEGELQLLHFCNLLEVLDFWYLWKNSTHQSSQLLSCNQELLSTVNFITPSHPP